MKNYYNTVEAEQVETLSVQTGFDGQGKKLVLLTVRDSNFQTQCLAFTPESATRILEDLSNLLKR